MRLFQINSTANWGSTGKIAEQIGLVAMENGWESYIAYGRYANPSKSHLVKIGTKFGLFWHLLESRLCDNHGLASRIATRKLVRQIESIKPDIIHLHNIHGYYLNYKILFEYLAKKGIPVVWTLHDCWSFTGHCAHYVQEQCDQWKDCCRRRDCKKKYPTSYTSKSRRNFNLKKNLFLEVGDKLVIVPVSSWLADQAKQSFFKKNKIEYIYNGVDINVFSPQDVRRLIMNYQLEGKTIILGVASTWTESKGLSDYLTLRTILPEHYIIVMLGLDKQMISKLPSGIIGIERTQSTKELAEWYSIADMVLSLSRAETFGLTVAEGMACGTPAVVYNNTAVPELITEETGCIVERTGDIDGVIAAIQEIQLNGKAHYSSACRRRAEEFFDKNKCFHKYIELYSEILTDRNR